MRPVARHALTLLAALSLLLCLATAGLWLQSRAVAASRPATPRAQRGVVEIDTALRCQIDRKLPDMRFNDNDLVDVIDFLRDVTGANVLVDWPALKGNGVGPDTRVTLDLRDLRFGAALTRITRSAGDGLRLVESNGCIYLTTASAQARDPHVEQRVSNPRPAVPRGLALSSAARSPDWGADLGSRRIKIVASSGNVRIWLYPADALPAYQDDEPVGRAAAPDEELVFDVGHASLHRARSPIHSWVLSVPYWELILLTGFAPSLWFAAARRCRRVRQRAGALAAGRCLACGYDLRASPDRCPECGTRRTMSQPASP